MIGRGCWRRRRAGLALAIVVAVLSSPGNSYAFVPPPVAVPGAVVCIEYALYCGPGGQLLEDTLAADVSAGIPSLGALGLLGLTSLLFIAGDTAPTQLVVQGCVDKINAHGGFPQFTGAGLLPGSQSGADCSAVQLLEYGVYSGTQIANLMPWERQFCVAAYSGSDFGAGPGWGNYTGGGQPAGLQAMVDAACPAVWRPFILGTAGSPLTGGVVDPAASLQAAPSNWNSGPLAAYCNMVTDSLSAGTDQRIQLACSYATPPGGYVLNEVGLSITGHPGQIWQKPGGYCPTNPPYFTESGCGWTEPAAGSFRAFGVFNYATSQAGDWTVGHNTLGLGGVYTQPIVFTDGHGGSINGWMDLNIALGTSVPVMPSQYWITAPTTPATVVPPVTVAPLTTIAPAVTVAPAPAPATMPAPGTSPDGNTGTSWLGQLFSTAVGVMTAGITAALLTVENVMRWVGSLLQTLQSNLLAGITWMVNSLLGILQQILAAVQAVSSAIGALADVVVQAVNAVAAPIVAAVVAAAAAIVAAVAGVATAVATAIATQLQTLLVPDATEFQAQVDVLKGKLAPTFLGTAVATVGGFGAAVTGGAATGMSGVCGPTFGFDGIDTGGISVPGFRLYMPSAPGCTGNGPAGAQTTYDTQGYNLLGYRTLVRGIEGFVLAWAFFMSIARGAPWSGHERSIDPSPAAGAP